MKVHDMQTSAESVDQSMSKKSSGKKRPQITKAILDFASKQPGGVVTWAECLEIFEDMTTQRIGRGNRNHHMNLGTILKKYFVKVRKQNSQVSLAEFQAAYPHAAVRSGEDFFWDYARSLYILRTHSIEYMKHIPPDDWGCHDCYNAQHPLEKRTQCYRCDREYSGKLIMDAGIHKSFFSDADYIEYKTKQ